MSRLSQQIISRLHTILPEGKPLPLHEPFFEGNEKKYLMECIETRFVSSVGAFVDQFEKKLAAFTGAQHAVAVINGTSALHLALKIAGVMPGDEVLVPALTFVATANAVIYCGATPHFVDSCQDHPCMDVQKLDDYLNNTTVIRNETCINKATGNPIRVVIPVHIFGHPVDMEPLLEIASKYRICVVEDAAESIGSYYNGIHTGNFGQISAFSFNGNKTITTGGGGAILCNDPELAKRAKHMSTTARNDVSFHPAHDEIGFNYRMPNINAAIGCAQLEQLPDILNEKRALAKKYQQAFADMGDILLLWESDNTKSNFWLNTLLLKQSDPDLLRSVIETTHKHKIFTRPAWELLSNLPMFKKMPAMDLSSAADLKNRIINIPSSQNL